MHRMPTSQNSRQSGLKAGQQHAREFSGESLGFFGAAVPPMKKLNMPNLREGHDGESKR
jgi:hypothetical protein